MSTPMSEYIQVWFRFGSHSDCLTLHTTMPLPQLLPLLECIFGAYLPALPSGEPLLHLVLPHQQGTVPGCVRSVGDGEVKYVEEDMGTVGDLVQMVFGKDRCVGTVNPGWEDFVEVAIRPTYFDEEAMDEENGDFEYMAIPDEDPGSYAFTETKADDPLPNFENLAIST